MPATILENKTVIDIGAGIKPFFNEQEKVIEKPLTGLEEYLFYILKL